jgi:lipid biosynthesis B12-binding/radical SAM protein
MSRILLISTNRVATPYEVYPLGMAVVAGALAARGHQVEQFDLLAAGKEALGLLEKQVEDQSPDFVCLSLRNLDNVDSLSGTKEWYLDRDRDLVAQLRKLTRAPIIVGGAAFSLMPEEILDYLKADYGVVGEGEKALGDLLEELSDDRRSGKDPGRLVYGERVEDGREFGRPLFSEKLQKFYRQKCGIIGLQTKRGCPHSCVYCSYPALEGRVLRHRPVGLVADEIEQLLSDGELETLFFVDSVFNDAEGVYLHLAEELIRRSLKVRWSAFFRPAGLTRDNLKLLQRAGLFALEMGTDALTEPTLAGLGKGFSLDEIFQTHDNCRSLGLAVAHYLIFGGPGETPTTLKTGLKNLDRLAGGVIFPFSGLRIIPETSLYHRALREEVVAADTSLLKPVYYFSPEIDPSFMNREIAAACHGHRERLFPPADAFVRMAVMRRFGVSGLLWDQLLSSEKLHA